MVQRTLALGDEDPLPLYHVDGEMNIADLLTKEHSITVKDVSEGSLWQTGPAWLSLPVDALPLKKYDQIYMKKEEEKEALKECFSEPFMTSGEVDTLPSSNGLYSVKPAADQLTPPDSLDLPMNLVHHGWVRARNLLMGLLRCVDRWVHKSHLVCKSTRNCVLCNAGDDKFKEIGMLEKRAEYLMYRKESDIITKTLSPQHLKRFQKQDGIWWSAGKFDSSTKFKCEDLEVDVSFYDDNVISPVVPVVRDGSEIFHSYAMHIHLKIRPHPGIEATMKEIYLKMFVLGNPRRIVSRILKDFTKCRRIHLKTVELKMAQHTQERALIAPPFFAIQLDIAYGFSAVPWKKARNKVTLYALVDVCLLSSATSILFLEGISTEDIVAALERHSSRYGVLGIIYTDNGTQLAALASTTFNPRSMENELKDRLDEKVVVSCPKAHEERGRVERRIWLIRDMLQRTREVNYFPAVTTYVGNYVRTDI